VESVHPQETRYELTNLDDDEVALLVDQNRIRENMKALKGSSEEKALLQRYVGQLDAQESRLASLRKESADLTVQLNLASSDLNRIIMEVSADQTF